MTTKGTDTDSAIKDEPRRIDLTVETITPEMATTMLSFNHPENRKQSRPHIDIIAKAMREGTFMLTGDAIRFDTTGRLIDGQHRLAACILADVPFETAVARNVEPPVMLHLDAGKKRTTQEQLTMATGTAAHVTDCVLMLLRMGVGNAYTKVTTDDLARIIAHYPQITNAANAYEGSAKFQLGGNLPAAELIMRGLGYQARADAWRKVWAGRLRDDDGIIALSFRERLIINSEMGRSWNQTEKRKALANAIEKHLVPDAAVPKLWKVPQNVITFPLFTVQRLVNGMIDFGRSDPAPLNSISSTKSLWTHTMKGASKRTEPSKVATASKKWNDKRKATAAAKLAAAWVNPATDDED